MWPFNRRRTEAARLRQAFGGYLSEEAIRALGTPRGKLEPRIGRHAYVLLQVRGDDPAQVARHFASAVDLLVRHDGIALGMLPPFVMAAFALPHAETDLGTAQARQAATVAALIEGLGPNVRLIHGTEDGLMGAVGSRQHLHYGLILPESSAKMAKLLSLDFGTAAEA